jgi:hypothetical protein
MKTGIAMICAGLFVFVGVAKAQENVLDHAGSIKIGTPFSELKSKSAWKAVGYRGDDNDDMACEVYYGGNLLPAGVVMMVYDGKVVRFDLGGDAKISGPFGIGIGDSEKSVLEKLPKATTVVPHFYSGEPDHHLTWHDPQTNLAIRVDTEQGKVSLMYWGQWEQVQYVEGCL